LSEKLSGERRKGKVKTETERERVGKTTPPELFRGRHSDNLCETLCLRVFVFQKKKKQSESGKESKKK
jgi:hypothetical protein